MGSRLAAEVAQQLIKGRRADREGLVAKCVPCNVPNDVRLRFFPVTQLSQCKFSRPEA